MSRRVLAMLTMLVMLRLTFVGAGTACIEHGHHGAMAGMSDAPASDAVAGHRSHDAGAPAPCDAPASAHCCDAAASCAITALAAPAGGSMAIVTGERTLVSATQHLLSRALGPEPPPPRA